MTAPLTYMDRLLEGVDVEWKPLGEIFKCQNGYTPSKANPEFWENGDIPWFRMEDIRENGHILHDAIQKITQPALKGGKIFPKNSIIMATSATIGDHALIQIPYLSNQRFTNLILKNDYKKCFNIKFLFYYGYVLGEWCRNNTTKSSFASVDMAGFKKFLIPIPPLHVQDRIVQILDKFTSLAAELTAELNARKKQYNYYRDKLLHFGPDVEWKPLGEILLNNIGGGTPSKAKKTYWDGDIPWASVGDLRIENAFVKKTRNSITQEGLKNSSTKLVKKGSLIFAMKIFPGLVKIADTDISLNQDLRGLICDDSVLHKYIYYYINKINISGNGTIVKSITSKDIEKIKIPVPPLAEQERIVSILDKFDALTHSITEGLPREIELRRKQYEHYRDMLLTFPKPE